MYSIKIPTTIPAYVSVIISISKSDMWSPSLPRFPQSGFLCSSGNFPSFEGQPLSLCPLDTIYNTTYTYTCQPYFKNFFKICTNSANLRGTGCNPETLCINFNTKPANFAPGLRVIIVVCKIRDTASTLQIHSSFFIK